MGLTDLRKMVPKNLAGLGLLDASDAREPEPENGVLDVTEVLGVTAAVRAA